jgi:hypothetical protein
MVDVISPVKAPDGKNLMKTAEQVEAEKRQLMVMPSLEGPQSKHVPPMSPQTVSGSVAPSKGVPQQTDKGKDGIA